MKRELFFMIVITAITAIVFIPGCGGGSDDETVDEIAGDDPKVGENTIPIQVENADGVGALHIELVYDSSIIEVTDVTLGSLGENGQVDYELATPGRVVVGFIDAMGMNGSGDVVEINFTENTGGESSLVLENVVATDAETLYDLVVQTSAGSLDTNNDISTSPVITVGQ